MVEKKCALIIANSEFEDPLLRQLIAPAQDAEALAQVLRDPAICGFEVDTILNESRHRVEEEIEAFFLDRARDDLLLLYFSGHGVIDEDGLLYYAARNTHHKRLRSTAVAANFVNDSMTRCRSRRQVLLLDCCHSGAFARTKAGPAVNLGQQFGEAGRGRFILASSDAYQYSFEGDAVQGSAVGSVFTQALVEGLRTGEADRDNDGLITLDELYDYVHRRVTDQTPQQSPRKWAYEVDGGLTIASNPSPAEAPLPDDLRLAIDSFVPEAREAAVKRLDNLLRGKHRGLALAAHKALLSLANDDSRRVASAAEKCLAAGSEQIRALEQYPRAAATPTIAVRQPKPDERRPAAEETKEQEEREHQAASEKARLKQEERERQAVTAKVRECHQVHVRRPWRSLFRGMSASQLSRAIPSPGIGVPPDTQTETGVGSPGLAATLGFIPGVGAMYNGEYAKGLVHALIFAILLWMTDHVNGLFALGIVASVIYMPIEAYRTARARQMGLAVPDPLANDRLDQKERKRQTGVEREAQNVAARALFGVKAALRPRGIVLIALWHFLSALLLALSVMLGFAIVVGGNWIMKVLGGLFTPVLFICAAIAVAVGYGVWTFRAWGRILCIILALMGLPFEAVGVMESGGWFFLYCLLRIFISVFTLWYLMRPPIKALFQRAAPVAPSA